MKIAIPVSEGKLFTHFGHCPAFALIDVDEKKKCIISRTDFPSPPHEPGLLPTWLAEKSVNIVMAGGIGAHACNMLAEKGIKVIFGVPVASPESLAQDYLDEKLKTGSNSCDH
ncbi:MAG: NifB/NifX family molybdenum-iron cluster-binding protein [Alphaproteobacteria bacterium]|nr:NifB/NifX family molybdenum-iron cluster-binding protein [Alphaproteobacteria bacterium]MCK5519399.1 NifB/NifX family molybdenum-iron cluster-binding protein [Alphaproteobacteria bacterium]MCK5554786.1 NifB/NifX family molybdenum-iron cluster-binding protein [Alphaproteobacteria bacterium]MCK5659359.1 NifB/NifX family molybdenum-iron cluster-binding protein [Alphaproteobacteria bacterium]